MNQLNNLGITVGKDNKAEIVFDSLFSDFRKIEYLNPTDYINVYWDAFKSHSASNNNLNGKIFEYILATLFVREGLLPLYLSAKVAFVPNVIYDLMFCCCKKKDQKYTTILSTHLNILIVVVAVSASDCLT